MTPTVDIISIGQLACNPFWDENEPKRPPVATTTLIRSGDTKVIVDPSPPAELLARQLYDRSGLTPDQIDLVFMTSFHPTHRRAISLFDDARWLISLPEHDAVSQHLNNALDSGEAPDEAMVEAELAILGRTEPAADLIADAVHLFPCDGISPGSSGLLVAALKTYMIAGDAVLTRDHLDRGQVYDGSIDRAAAEATLAEIYEIADVIVPGHDNLIIPATHVAAGF